MQNTHNWLDRPFREPKSRSVSNDDRPDLRTQLKASLKLHRRTWRDDLSDFIRDVSEQPYLAGTVFGLGIATGLMVTVGLAYIIAAVSL